MAKTKPPVRIEPFVVKHYFGDSHTTIKGNGFDGLAVGGDRPEAEDFVQWVNARLAELVEYRREEEDNG
jgi:hypothetical protein